MPLSRDTLEHQMKLAKESLAKWIVTLTERGVERSAFRRDTQWRHLNAQCNKIRRRLDRVAEIEAVNAEVARRKAERLAAVESE